MGFVASVGKGLFDRTVWETRVLAGGGIADFKDNELLCFMMLEKQTRLHAIGLDPSKTKLTAMVDDAVADPTKKIHLAVSGAFQLPGRSEGSLMGHVYQGVGGRVRGAPASGTRGFLVYNKAFAAFQAPIQFGQGDTAAGFSSASLFDAGFTGLIPLVMGKSAVGAANDLFQSASPGSAIGRTVVAHHSQSGLLLVVVNKHPFLGRFGGSGPNLFQLMGKLVDAGADDAVSSDGSDSVFVNFRKAFVERPSDRKDGINITAMGFSFEP